MLKLFKFLKSLFRFEFSIKFPRKWRITRIFYFWAWWWFLPKLKNSQLWERFKFFCHIFFSENAAISGGRLAYFQYWSAMYNVRKKCHLLEQILCPTSQHEFLVYFHIQLGTLWLQLPSACCSPWVRTLKTWNIKICVNKGVEYCHKLKFVIPISLQPGGVNI